VRRGTARGRPLHEGNAECDPETHAGCTSSQRELTDTPEPTTSSRIDFVFARPGSCGASPLASSVIGDAAVQLHDGRWRWPSDHFGVVSALRCRVGSD